MPNAKPASSYAVYLSQEGAEDVNYGTDLTTLLIPQAVEWMAGGRCRAVFTLDISQSFTNIQNITTPTKWNRQVEVWAIVDAIPQPIFWGDLTLQELRISQTESATFVATVEPWHFGNFAESLDFWSELQSDFIAVNDGEILFNPVIDGNVEFNMSTKEVEVSGTTTFRTWVDPESVRSTEAETANGQTADEWTIPEAIHSLCWLLNPDERYIDNFDKNDARYDGVFDEAPKIVGLRMRMGQYLPAYLDALLKPLGFDWYIELAPEAKRIVVFKQYAGESKKIKMQAIGEDFDFDRTNCPSITLEHNLSAVVNTVICYGATEEREITVELFRAWAEADDGLQAAELDKKDPDSDFETKPNVWRKWVANEAGDYCELRDTVAPIGDEPLDLTSVADMVPRRRRFKDCITRDADGNVRPPFVEYYDPDAMEWVPVPSEWQVTILTREMGVYFDGDFPPESLIQYAGDARVRVTGSVTFDKRLKGEALGVANSPSGRTQTLYLDVSDRFLDRQTQTTGTYATVLTGDVTDEVDDQTAIDEYAQDILDYNQYIGMRADIQLIDLNTEYRIGQLLTDVEGREVSLNLNSADAPDPKYPQIVGIVWEPQDLITRLVVAT